MQLARLFPGLSLVAVGPAADGRTVLAVLRARIKDSVGVDEAPAEAVCVVRRLSVECASAEPTCRGHVLAVLGVRPGVSATTLATNLATLIRRAPANDVMLLDLGQPLRDGTLYLNVQVNFHFVKAVRNLRRSDQVLVQTALSRHPNGLVALPLPISLVDMCDTSSFEVFGLLNRLRTFLDLQVVNLGGLDNIDFIAQIIKAADDVMSATEWSVGVIVSAAELMRELRKREIGRDHSYLTISKFDVRLSLDAAQTVERLEIPSVPTVSNRCEALVIASNQGAMPAETYPTDAYVRVLARAVQILDYAQQSAYVSALSSWVSGVSARLGGRFGGRSKHKSADITELDIGTTERDAT